MKIVKIVCLILLLHFVSCSSDENQSQGNNIKSYNYMYMDYSNVLYVPADFPQVNGSSGSVKLKYDFKNRINKRIGGLETLPASLGSVGYLFSDEVTEDIVYTNDQIKITRNTPNCNCFFERKMILDNKNRMIKKIMYNQEPQPNDSIFYTYNNLNQIDETLKQYGIIQHPQNKTKRYEKAKYYYNAQQNLDSIVTVTYYEEYGSLDNSYKTVQRFSNFDNASNPLKKLIIFDETYLRAISKNNYAKYEQLSYRNNELQGSSGRNFEYKYDSSGKIQFDFK